MSMRPVDVVYQQNKSAIKDLMEKGEHRKGRDVYVVGVTNVEINPHQYDYQRNHKG